MPYKFLVIQTAFIGDVVLATAIAEKLHVTYPDSIIDFVVRKGNESLLADHPFINKTWVWDKKSGKIRNLLRLCTGLRSARYTHVINPHRFLTSGILSLLSGASHTAGFDKNPLSFVFTRKVKHVIAHKNAATFQHDTERNQLLISDITEGAAARPRLYPTTRQYEKVKPFQGAPYVTISPASVWFTKQFPKEKWTQLVQQLTGYRVYLLGGKGDSGMAADILNESKHPDIHNLCGQLGFLESTALMQGALMNYTNDSAPQHFASAVGANLTAVFCSTIPQFGFGPVDKHARVVEITDPLYCRPCGLHGHRECPEKHFRCAKEITNEQLLWWTLNKT